MIAPPTPDDARQRLMAALAALEAENSAGQDDQATVALDQQSVGRLSRIDALQRQAMAQATQRRREMAQRRIIAALQRLDNGEYGYCTDCGDEIAPARLAFDPAVPLCLSCARG